MRPSEDRLQALRDYYVDDVDGAGDVEDLFAEIDALTRERDRLIENVQACNERSRNLAEKADRAEKAERALAAAELEKEGARRGEDEAWEKWQKAERALAECEKRLRDGQ